MNIKKTFLRMAAVCALAFSPMLVSCDTLPSDPLAAAKEALANGEPRSALDYATAALENDPNNTALLLIASDAAMALSEPDRAITELEKISSDAPEYELAQAKLADAQLEGGYLQAAEQTIQGIELDSPFAHKVMVKFHLADGEVARAFEALDAGLEAFPDDPALVTYDADRIWATGNVDKALSRLAPALEVEPIVYEAHLFAGKASLSSRDLTEAEGHFKKVLSVRPLDQTAMLAMAAISNDRGDTETAANWLNKLGESVQPSPAWALFSAQMAYQADDLDRAFGLVEKVPASMASQPQFLRLRGLIDARRDQHAMAALSLGAYVEETGGDILTRQLLARSYGEEGQFLEGWQAIKPVIDHPQMDMAGLTMAYQLAQRASPSDLPKVEALIEKKQAAPDLRAEMIEAGEAIRAGDWAKADAIFKPLVAGKGKNDPALLNNAAAVKSKLGQHEEAIGLARRALEQAPTSAAIMDTLGWALWEKGGSVAEARAMLTRARDAAPGNQDIANHWAIAHAE
ncbi:MAG: tetratricopeptide repeat protein [Pseudomonadota bacterium]